MATQTVFLSERGDERFEPLKRPTSGFLRDPSVSGRAASRWHINFFNINNTAPVVALNSGVGATYLAPGEILALRIIRVGFSIDY